MKGSEMIGLIRGYVLFSSVQKTVFLCKPCGPMKWELRPPTPNGVITATGSHCRLLLCGAHSINTSPPGTSPFLQELNSPPQGPHGAETGV